MNIIGVCSAALIASVLATVLKKSGAEYSFILTVCASALVFVYVLSVVVTSLTQIGEIYAFS